MRCNRQDCGSLVLLMTEAAICLLAGLRQDVAGVQLVLFSVKQSIESGSLREVALRRPGVETASGFVADGAGLLRPSRELSDVALGACFMAREFQAQLFVAWCRLNDAAGYLPVGRAVVAGIALEVSESARAGNLDASGVRLVGEFLVINWFLLRDTRRLLLSH